MEELFVVIVVVVVVIVIVVVGGGYLFRVLHYYQMISVGGRCNWNIMQMRIPSF